MQKVTKNYQTYIAEKKSGKNFSDVISANLQYVAIKINVQKENKI